MTTAKQFRFGGNVQYRKEKEDLNDIEYKNTVENFGTAFAANYTAFSQLTKMNQHPGSNLTSCIAYIQQQVNHLAAIMQNFAMAGTTNQSANQQQNHNKKSGQRHLNFHQNMQGQHQPQ